jgi:uncharacterized protein YbcI
MTDAIQADGHEGQSVNLAVSNAMVKLYKELFGRGPTKARTHYAGPDLLVASLEDTFTAAEKRLAEMGEITRLRDTRMFFQYASEDQFRGEIERITGRKVVGFVSGLDAANDIAAELFYLEPEAVA